MGSVAVRFAAFIAVACLFVGLLNRPSGDLSPAVDITPHSQACAGTGCTSGR